MAKPGVYQSKKKDGTIYYRSSITYKNKHISLGSFPAEKDAHNAYLTAKAILDGILDIALDDYSPSKISLSFEKWVILFNLRDNGIYFKTPIYLKNRFFLYYLDQKTILKFAVDDLFYYANHKIMRRGGHYFVADFGMQVNILSRYGIRNFAVDGRDFRFVNGDHFDYRYENIEIVNKYHGVFHTTKKGFPLYIAKIHINGDYIIGKYKSETEAAVAYNKAADFLMSHGIPKQFPSNYVTELTAREYAELYTHIRISKRILAFGEQHKA